MSNFLIRVSSPAGLSRIELPRNATSEALFARISQDTGISPNNIRISFDNRKWITLPPSSQLAAFREFAEEGVRVFVAPINAEAPAPQPTAAVQPGQPKPSPKCDHGPNQRCLRCIEPPKKEEEPADKRDKSREKKPSDAKDQKEKSPSRRCDHGPRQKCLKCIDTGEKKDGEYIEKKEARCNHGPNGRCLNCMNNESTNIKHQAFDDYIDRNFAKCKNHAAGQRCNNCLIDLNFNYKLKDCKNHEPYPKGMCSACIPPSISVRRQLYRHVDYAQFNNFVEIQGLIQFWLRTQRQRVAYLYGYYAEDPVYEKGVRAIVEALYEPPQENDFNATQFRQDPMEHQVGEIARALGFERLGWVFTTHNKDVFLSSEEMIRAAMIQEQFKFEHPCGVFVSKQITVVLRGDEKGVTPEVYMISDQGQSLVRDQIIESPESRKYLKVKRAEKTNYSPKFLYQGKEVEQIEPDFFIVNVAHGQPMNNKFNVMLSADFPPANRPEPQRTDQLRDYFRKNRTRSFAKYANFQLLLYIAKAVDLNTSIRIAECVKNQVDLPDDLEKFVLSRVN